MTTQALAVFRLLAISSLAFVGCAASISSQKQASFARSSQQLRDLSITQYADTHTGVLFTGTDEVDQLHLADGEVHGLFKLKGEVCRTIGGCAAVPIDSRGYWLTAKHCTESGAVLLYTLSKDEGERGIPVRIVWQGDTPGLDMALLYAPFPDGVVPIEVASDIRVGEEVLCIGSGMVSSRYSAGRVIGVGGSSDGSIVWIEHDAPLSAGDSGGAVVYQDGLLAGINFEAGRTFSGSRSKATAIKPDMTQLSDIINDDWLVVHAGK